jgi:hypothetical protein
VRFQVLTAARIKMAVSWVVAKYSLIILPTFQWYLLPPSAASTSETSVNFYQTTRRNNPEDNHLRIT